MIGTVWSSALVEQQAAVLQNFFSAKSTPRYHEMRGELRANCSGLAQYPTTAEERLPELYCWLSSEGVTAGHFAHDKQDGAEILQEDWFRKHRMSEGRYEYPLGVALSEFHVFLAFENKFQAISILDQKLAFEDLYGVSISSRLGSFRTATASKVRRLADS